MGEKDRLDKGAFRGGWAPPEEPTPENTNSITRKAELLIPKRETPAAGAQDKPEQGRETPPTGGGPAFMAEKPNYLKRETPAAGAQAKPGQGRETPPGKEKTREKTKGGTLLFVAWAVLCTLSLGLYAISGWCERRGLVLRSGPRLVLFALLVAAVLATALAAGLAIFRWGRRQGKSGGRIFAAVANTLLAFAALALAALALFAAAFAYTPEHPVERAGQKMLACVDSFTDVKVYYYPYINGLFRGGELLGEEWYGSGGYDPFATEMDVHPRSSTFAEE